jgi:hypothetical protein
LSVCWRRYKYYEYELDEGMDRYLILLMPVEDMSKWAPKKID